VQGMGGNILQLNPLMCDGDPNVIYSFDIFPLLNKIMDRYVAGDLSIWGFGADNRPMNITGLPGWNSHVYSNDPGNCQLLFYDETLFGSGLVPCQDQNEATYDRHTYDLTFGGIMDIQFG